MALAAAQGAPTGAGGTPGTPWARTPELVDDAYATVAGQMRQIAARSPCGVTELSVAEQYALGIRAAAQWTTGRTTTAPLLAEPRPADVDAAIHVMAIADDLMMADDVPEQVAALAGGIRAWLLWLVGTEDQLMLRPL